MKKLFLLLILCASSIFLAVPNTARADDTTVSFDYFYNSLAPYGDWIDLPDYGYCWRPRGVDSDWAPYADGYWTYTDAGWTWVSYEDFGSIVYHYGRWIQVEDEGWCWKPDYEWAPAWVSWRRSDDYVGWAPLPPEARWNRDTGVGVWVDTVCDIGPGYYNFCRYRDFGAPVLRPVILDRRRNSTFITNTVNITNITYVSDGEYPVVFNGGLAHDYVAQRSSRPISTLRLRRTRGEYRNDGVVAFRARQAGDELIVAAPRITAPVSGEFFRNRNVQHVNAVHVNRGWNEVSDPQARQQLRQTLRAQSRGLTPESAPAQKVSAAALQVIPQATTAGNRERRNADDRRSGNDPGAKNPAVLRGAFQPGQLPATSPSTAVSGEASSLSPGSGAPERTGRQAGKNHDRSAEGAITSRENSPPTSVKSPAAVAPQNPAAQPMAETDANSPARSAADQARERARQIRERTGEIPAEAIPRGNPVSAQTEAQAQREQVLAQQRAAQERANEQQAAAMRNQEAARQQRESRNGGNSQASRERPAPSQTAPSQNRPTESLPAGISAPDSSGESAAAMRNAAQAQRQERQAQAEQALAQQRAAQERANEQQAAAIRNQEASRAEQASRQQGNRPNTREHSAPPVVQPAQRPAPVPDSPAQLPRSSQSSPSTNRPAAETSNERQAQEAAQRQAAASAQAAEQQHQARAEAAQREHEKRQAEASRDNERRRAPLERQPVPESNRGNSSTSSSQPSSKGGRGEGKKDKHGDKEDDH